MSLISSHLLHNLVTSLLHLGYNFCTRNMANIVRIIFLPNPLFNYFSMPRTNGTCCNHFYCLKNLNNLNNLKYLNHPFSSSFSSSSSFNQEEVFERSIKSLLYGVIGWMHHSNHPAIENHSHLCKRTSVIRPIQSI